MTHLLRLPLPLLAACCFLISSLHVTGIPTGPGPLPQSAAPAPLSIPDAYALSYTLDLGTFTTSFIPAEFGDALLGDPANQYKFDTTDMVMPFPDPTGCAQFADPPGYGVNADYCDPTTYAKGNCRQNPPQEVLPANFQPDYSVPTTFYTGRPVLIAGSSACDAGQKALWAQKAGAKLVIIYSRKCVASDSDSCTELAATLNSNGLSQLSITTLSIANGPGTNMANRLNVRDSGGLPATPVEIIIQGTGPISPNDYSALLNFAQGITYFPPNDGLGGTTRSLSELRNDTTKGRDPCTNRMRGVWCSGNPGKVATLNVNYGVGGMIAPSSIGMLDSLRTLNLANSGFTNKFTGVIPEDFGTGLKKLRSFLFDNNLITALPNSIAGMTQLLTLGFSSNQISLLPTTLSNLPNLQVISGSNNKIWNFLDGFNQMASLALLDLGSNQINVTGSTFNFQKHPSIQYLLLKDNKIGGFIWPNAFDNIPFLAGVDVSTNYLSGLLPTLSGTTNVVALDFSNNVRTDSGDGLWSEGLSDGIPTAWSSLIYLKKLVLSNNQLTNPISSLNSCESLELVDLSFNRITLGNDSSTGVGSFITHSFPNSIRSINLASNLLSGPFPPGALEQKSNLEKLYLSHNKITSIPTADLFSFSKVLDTFDISYNQVSGFLPTADPPVTIVSLKFQGNSGLKSPDTTNPSIPSWLIPASDGSVGKTNVLDTYVCPLFVGKTSPSSVSIDPSYYNYKLCTCDRGSYGTAPACPNIPAKVDPQLFAANTTIDPNSGLLGQNFTDGAYGSQRYFQGMDTIWVIALTLAPSVSSQQEVGVPMNALAVPSSTSSSFSSHSLQHSPLSFAADDSSTSDSSSVLAIYITFQLDRKVFHNFQDLIEVYEGDEQLKGERVASFRGSDPDPVNKYGLALPANTIVVFSSKASVNFRSNATSGVHFTANYRLMSSCPAGFLPTAEAPDHPNVPQTCTPELPVFSPSVAVQGVVWAFSIISFLFVLGVTFFVYQHRNTAIIRSSSVPFCMSVLIFNLLLPVGAIFYAIYPDKSGDFVCHARPWFTAFGFVGALSSLLVKANRIRWIFTNTNFSTMVQTNLDLVKKASVLIGFQLFLMIVYSVAAAFTLTGQEFVVGHGTTAGYMVWQCRSFTSPPDGVFFILWIIFEFSFVLTLLAGGLWIAFAIRHVPAQYNESVHIANCLFAIFAFCILIVPIQFIIDDNAAALMMLRGLGQNLTSVVICATVFMPKIYNIMTGIGDEQKGDSDTRSAKGQATRTPKNGPLMSPSHTRDKSLGAPAAGSGHQRDKSVGGGHNREKSQGHHRDKSLSRGPSIKGTIGGPSSPVIPPKPTHTIVRSPLGAQAGKGPLASPSISTKQGAKSPNFIPLGTPVYASSPSASIAPPSMVAPGPSSSSSSSAPMQSRVWGSLAGPVVWPPPFTGPASERAAYNPYGPQSAPTPEYVRSLEQQNFALWQTQKALSDLLMNPESQKWLKLMQVSVTSVTKLNPVQQLTSKSNSVSDSDIAQEAVAQKKGASASSASEFISSVERQNRLLWETQGLVSSIFSNPEAQKWIEQAQTAVTALSTLHKVDSLVMRPKEHTTQDASSGSSFQSAYSSVGASQSASQSNDALHQMQQRDVSNPRDMDAMTKTVQAARDPYRNDTDEQLNGTSDHDRIHVDIASDDNFTLSPAHSPVHSPGPHEMEMQALSSPTGLYSQSPAMEDDEDVPAPPPPR